MDEVSFSLFFIIAGGGFIVGTLFTLLVLHFALKPFYEKKKK